MYNRCIHINKTVHYYWLKVQKTSNQKENINFFMYRTPKTQKSNRIIYMTEDYYALLNQLLDECINSKNNANQTKLIFFAQKAD